jgi:hypothetical protein
VAASPDVLLCSWMQPCRSTSNDTTQDRCDIRSYIDTTRKHGQYAVTVLRGIFTGNPWQPPLPATISP